MSTIRMLLVLVLIAGSFTISACGIKPWVKPYERANMADPIMSFARDPVAESYKNHVHQAREGARGAESGAGGGCGCN
ncbi:MAG: DUF4266 domain-containing protein [Gammaproteobacteria bacterium]|nr:DUF4266 domain-containing protein [Gammaproteobacteria bacterium]